MTILVVYIYYMSLVPTIVAIIDVISFRLTLLDSFHAKARTKSSDRITFYRSTFERSEVLTANYRQDAIELVRHTSKSCEVGTSHAIDIAALRGHTFERSQVGAVLAAEVITIRRSTLERAELLTVNNAEVTTYRFGATLERGKILTTAEFE